jgi:hypothetical protein
LSSRQATSSAANGLRSFFVLRVYVAATQVHS